MKKYLIGAIFLLIFVSGSIYIKLQEKRENSLSINADLIYSLDKYKDIENNRDIDIVYTQLQDDLMKNFQNFDSLSAHEIYAFEKKLKKILLDESVSRYDKTKYLWNIFLSIESDFGKRYVLDVLAHFSPIEISEEMISYYNNIENQEIKDGLLNVFGKMSQIANVQGVTIDDLNLYTPYIERVQMFLKDTAYYGDVSDSTMLSMLDAFHGIMSANDTEELIKYYQEKGFEVPGVIVKRNQTELLLNQKNGENQEYINLLFEGDSSVIFSNLRFIYDGSNFDFSDQMSVKTRSFLENQEFDVSGNLSSKEERDYIQKEYLLSYIDSQSVTELNENYMQRIFQTQNSYAVALLLGNEKLELSNHIRNNSQYGSLISKLENALYSDEYTSNQKRRIQLILDAF